MPRWTRYPQGLRVAAAAIALLAPSPVQAQGLPAYRPVNPSIASRSALGFVPTVAPGAGWRFELRLDYSNVLEAQTRDDADYLLDAELTRLEFNAGRNLGRWFIHAALPLQSAQAGALDPFVTWWHGVFGFNEYVRASRPTNTFDYYIEFPGDRLVRPDRGGLALGDLRLTAGRVHRPGWQTAAIVALPTNGRPDGWGLETVALGLVTTGQALLWNRLTLEGSAGVGYAPRAGDLADWQRQFATSLSSGFRLRFWGRQSAYTNLLFHTGMWRGTTLSSLDNPDLSLDFGFLLQPGGGTEILAGMVEDLYPFGPAVDMVFRLGVRW